MEDWSERIDSAEQEDIIEKIDTGVEEEDHIRIVRKVEAETQPRNFIKDKLCDLGLLADVSMNVCGYGICMPTFVHFSVYRRMSPQ